MVGGRDSEQAASAAVRRVSQILEVISSNPRGVLAADVASALGMSRQTAARLLDSMLVAGLAVRDDDSRRYRLSLTLYFWGGQAAVRAFPGAPIRQELVALAQAEAPHPTFYSVLEGTRVFALVRMQVLNGETITMPMSSRSDWHESPSGLAIAAFAAPETLQLLLASPSSDGLSKDEHLSRIEEVRRQGFAEKVFGPNRSSFAAPILDDSGYAIASLGMGVNHYESEERERLVSALKAAAARCSSHLGHSPFLAAP